MADTARPFDPDPGPEVARERSRAGAVLGALAAVAVSGGLAWWFSGAPEPSRPAPPPAAAPSAPAPPLTYAGPEPDPGQVRRAYTDVRRRYAQADAQGLVQTSVECAKALQTRPQRLDYCLAFDLYAAEIVPTGGRDADAAGWFHDGGQRALALARAALPAGTDAANRIAQVRALTVAVLPKAVRGKHVKSVRRSLHRVHAKSRPLFAAGHVAHPSPYPRVGDGSDPFEGLAAPPY